MRHVLHRAIAALAAGVISFGLVPSALAGGPSLGTTGALAGVDVSYTTVPMGAETSLSARSTTDGANLRHLSVPGQWGIPRVTLNGVAGGLSHDGRVLVLAQRVHPNSVLRSETQFVAIDTRRLAVTHTIRLKGDFGYDALSPNGRTLYLIQHMPGGSFTKYRVRAYDLATNKLLPNAIADTRQKGWLMNGYPMARTATGDGRWVFTLYSNPNNYPFVHALDSVSKTAVCIGLPWKWTGSMEAIEKATMKLSQGDGKLTIVGAAGGGPRYVIDTETFRLL
jgi:hypothetical protein